MDDKLNKENELPNTEEQDAQVEEESLVKQEHVDRIMSNPEAEAPLVAQELYPDDEKAQKTFVEFIEKFVEILSD